MSQTYNAFFGYQSMDKSYGKDKHNNQEKLMNKVEFRRNTTSIRIK